MKSDILLASGMNRVDQTKIIIFQINFTNVGDERFKRRSL